MYEYKKLLYFLLLFFFVLLDQLSKYIVRASGGFYICNRGIALGIDWLWIFPVILVLIALLIIFQISNYQLLISNKISKSKFQDWKFNIRHFIRNWKLDIGNYANIYLPLSLILAGGISNVIDRLYFGCIIDFIDLKVWPASIAMRSIAGWPVFNLADVYITIGAIIIIKHITYNIKQKKN